MSSKMGMFLIAVLFLIQNVSSERILIFHLQSSYSHRAQTWPIAEALVKQGHDVSYIAPYQAKEPNPNISELVPKSLHNLMEKCHTGDFDVSLRVEGKMRPLHEFIFEMVHEACETLLSSPEFQDWLEKNKKFDLFIVDSCFSECGLGLAKYLGAKTIIFGTIASLPHEYDAIGFLPQSASIPELEVYSQEVPMNFFRRLQNTYLTLIWRWKHYLYSFKIDELLRNYLKAPPLPAVNDLFGNISLVFHTGDLISDYARSLPPLFVNVAGTHCRDPKALPKDMETFINSTKNDGFVYISLGSVVVPGNLPENIKQVFFDTIRAFPNLRFVWSWRGKIPEDIPDNLMLAKWAPQIDILGHPKIKGFVTQNGRPSTLEAIYLGVPMISFPSNGDQNMNANRLSEMGATTKLEIGTVTSEQFKDAIRKTAYDPAIKERVSQLQKIFRDQPMSPVDTALWWIAYVLKYEDTSHLKTAGYDQFWFVRRQVDVWAFVSFTLFLVIASALIVCRKLIYFIGSKMKLKSD